MSADGRGPYHPTTQARRDRGHGLGLFDATAMGVGGLIDGGIFSVLVWELARDDRTGLVVFGTLLVAVAVTRVAFRRRAGCGAEDLRP